jgi:hypothetical protein
MGPNVDSQSNLNITSYPFTEKMLNSWLNSCPYIEKCKKSNLKSVTILSPFATITIIGIIATTAYFLAYNTDGFTKLWVLSLSIKANIRTVPINHSNFIVLCTGLLDVDAWIL